MLEKFNSALSFHLIPKDETLKKMWIRNVQRENRTTSVSSWDFMSMGVIRVGQQHLKEGAVPVPLAWKPDQVSGGGPGADFQIFSWKQLQMKNMNALQTAEA